MLATRAWLGPHSQTASIDGSATIASTEGNARASPTPSSRASAADDSACSPHGLQQPRTSASRTPTSDWVWKRVMNPLPMNPMPSRWEITLTTG